MYNIVGMIPNFNRKNSYPGFEKKATEPVVKVNKCITTKVARTKKVVNSRLVEAKKEYKATNGKRKPILLTSNKLK